MVKSADPIRVSTVLPWFVCLLLVVALVFTLLRQRGGELGNYETVIRENELLSAMRLNLLRSAEAEKSAVLAITDEESRHFADQARVAAAGVDQARRELGALIARDHSNLETDRINEFDRCWTESQKVDRLVLDLAVQNTNLHAANLALTQGTQVLSRLEASLNRVIDAGTAEGSATQTVRPAYQALVAGLKIHDLYTPHIQAETDEQMDAIEKEIKANEELLSRSLDGLAAMAKGTRLEDIETARAAYADLAKVTAEIIELSRKNTNIKSLELSLGRKRLITAQCDEILSTLQDLIRNVGTRATR